MYLIVQGLLHDHGHGHNVDGHGHGHGVDGHGHGHGDGRLKRSGTIWNGPERNETKRSGTNGHGTVTFFAKNERFAVMHKINDFPPSFLFEQLSKFLKNAILIK